MDILVRVTLPTEPRPQFKRDNFSRAEMALRGCRWNEEEYAELLRLLNYGRRP